MSSSQAEIFVRAFSRLLGWIYTLCWSASFYPQPISNFRRGSTAGLAIDFPTINFLGFICYSVYTCAFVYSPVIRDQYATRNPTAGEPTVRFNDVAFAVHAMCMAGLIYTQFWPQVWGLRVSRSQRISKPMAGLFWGSILALLIVVWIVLAQSPDGGKDPLSWAWIDVIYAFSYIKLIITVVKYVPQAWLNYKRQSTVGWNIAQILLDLAGGILSLVQVVLDSSLQSDWSGITGNPVKFLLGNITVFFDLIFVIQHYILYRKAEVKRSLEEGLTRPLLADSNGLHRRE